MDKTIKVTIQIIKTLQLGEIRQSTIEESHLRLHWNIT